MSEHHAGFLAMATFVLAACFEENNDPAGINGAGGGAEDGTPPGSPSGLKLQGMEMQGMEMQGMEMQGMEMQGMEMQGMEMQGVNLQGTAFTGVARGRALAGADFAGASLNGLTRGGARVKFRVRDVVPDPRDRSGETLLYTLLFHDEGRGVWDNACKPDQDGVRKAIPLRGEWNSRGEHVDSGRFTFACTSGVIAKCVRWGYRPWQTVRGESLAAYHQACTRMARADYCGDGVSHTRNGTLIDIGDRLGIQTQADDDGMAFEAAWQPDGAYCVSRPRWGALGRDLSRECPSRLGAPGSGPGTDRCQRRLEEGGKLAVLMSNRSFVQP